MQLLFACSGFLNFFPESRTVAVDVVAADALEEAEWSNVCVKDILCKKVCFHLKGGKFWHSFNQGKVFLLSLYPKSHSIHRLRSEKKHTSLRCAKLCFGLLKSTRATGAKCTIFCRVACI